VAARRQRRLTPKIRELVAADRQSRPQVGRLTAAQADQLKVVARRRQDFEVPVDPPRAITALAEGAAPKVAVPVLKAVLADGRAPSVDRITAARGLGRIGTPQAERTLLQNLNVRDQRVRQEVFAALGIAGGPAAARALARLSPPRDRDARRQLLFARALIAHRHGLDGPFVREARPVERRPGRRAEMTELSMGTRTARATAAARGRLRGPTYGIDLADRAYTLRCGPAEWTVFVNRELGRSLASPALLERPWIAGILAQWLPEREAVTTRFVMLTRPQGAQIHVDVVRRDGEVVYTGTARPARPGVAFTITDVERPGTAPLTIAGRLRGTAVEVDTAVAFAGRVAQGSTLPAA